MPRPTLILVIAFLAICFSATNGIAQQPAAQASSGAEQVFELRTYTTHPGRLDALIRRFRDHTTRLFEKHGMVNIGYWVPQDEPLSENTLIYVLSHADRDGATESWSGFGSDPEWREARDASQADGPIVISVDRVFMDPTDFSALK